MHFLRSVGYIINYKTFIITAMAVIATWYCLRMGWYADFPLTIVGIAIVFPIVFSINSAYRRRERALRALAEAKGNLLGFYQTARNQMKDQNDEEIQRIKDQIIRLYEAIRQFLLSNGDDSKEKERLLYDEIAALGAELRRIRDQGVAGRFIARMNQYLTRVMVAVDNLKIVFHYRTPRTLRAYSKVFIYAFPILYAPYFAQTGIKYAAGLSYFMPVLFSFILVSLDNIQEHLEDPYDQIGEDDIKVDIEEIKMMLR